LARHAKKRAMSGEDRMKCSRPRHGQATFPPLLSY
jgi:hypothetical protein